MPWKSKLEPYESGILQLYDVGFQQGQFEIY